MRPSRSAPGLALILGATVVSACSIFNAPDDVVPGGAGGDGPAATSTGQGGDAASTSVGGSGPGSTSTGQGGGGAPPAACDEPSDCDATECEDAACDGGSCVVTPKAAGTACGPEGALCEAAGVCDGAGECFVADLEGASCEGCAGDPASCVCRGGLCDTCDAVAPINLFAGPDLPGWELTGSWGLYTRFPRDRQSPTEVPIGKRVLGTDGNRSHPYPGGADPAVGGAVEASSATSPLTTIPAQLTFRSWHEDEGGAPSGRDNKRIVIAPDGGGEVVVVDCAAGIRSDLPFCQLPTGGLAAQRPADAWDDVAIEVPAELAGASGRIVFAYDTVDAAGGRERGWFIDALGAAGRCGCATDDDCAFLAGPCSVAVCDAGACTYEARPGSEGEPCGAAATSTCSASDRCDASGLCSAADRIDGTACVDCDGGDCQACGAGACLACEAATQTFDGLLPTQGWTLEGDWATTTSAPASDVQPAVAFGSTMFGTDGGIGGPETSTATTIETAIPEILTFSSWHVDQGGADGDDNKTITIVGDGGARVVLVDCAAGIGADLPLCAARTTPRAASDRDAIAIPTGAAAGTVGVIELGYDTGGSTQVFEQGWYIDDLNAVRCP